MLFTFTQIFKLLVHNFKVISKFLNLFHVILILHKAPFDTSLWLMGPPCLNKDDLTWLDLEIRFNFAFHARKCMKNRTEQMFLARHRYIWILFHLCKIIGRLETKTDHIKLINDVRGLSCRHTCFQSFLLWSAIILSMCASFATLTLTLGKTLLHLFVILWNRINCLLTA